MGIRLVCWCDGVMVLWCYGSVVLWFFGVMVKVDGVMVLWCDGGWCDGSMVPSVMLQVLLGSVMVVVVSWWWWCVVYFSTPSLPAMSSQTIATFPLVCIASI